MVLFKILLHTMNKERETFEKEIQLIIETNIWGQVQWTSERNDGIFVGNVQVSVSIAN